MHLEYIYAMTKQKPVIVFMHEEPESRDAVLHDHKLELRENSKSLENSFNMKLIRFLLIGLCVI